MSPLIWWEVIGQSALIWFWVAIQADSDLRHHEYFPLYYGQLD